MKVPPVSFHVRFPPSVFEKLRTQAEQHHRSIAAEILTIVEGGLEGVPAPQSTLNQPPVMQPVTHLVNMEAPPPIPARSGDGPDYSSHVAARDISHALALNGPSSKQLGQILEIKLPTIRTLDAAVALGPQPWIDAGASETIVKHLFPSDEGAFLAAKKLRIKRASGKHYAAHGRVTRGHRIRQKTASA